MEGPLLSFFPLSFYFLLQQSTPFKPSSLFCFFFYCCCVSSLLVVCISAYLFHPLSPWLPHSSCSKSDRVKSMSVRADEDEPVRGPPSAPTTTWDFISTPVVQHPLEPPHSSSYRPWEGSELLLRGATPGGGPAYYNASNNGYNVVRNTTSNAAAAVDDRLPSFESQFNEPPTNYGSPQILPQNSIQNRTADSVYTIPHYSHLEAPNTTKKVIEQHQSNLLLHRPASSSSLDTHPTLVSQLRKKSAIPSRTDDPPESSSNQNPGQVAAISSTDPSSDAPSFKSNTAPNPHQSVNNTPNNTRRPPAAKARKTTSPVEKSTKKKRKRCGECSGCQKKDNCGDCAPCRNEKSHQICKVRRCERLIEKKPKKAASNISSDVSKITTQAPRSQMNRQIDLQSHPTNNSPHFGFTQTPLPMSDPGLWCPNGSTPPNTTTLIHHNPIDQQSWTPHYQSHHNNMGPASTQASTTNIHSTNSTNLFEHHAFDSFIRRPTPNSPGILLNPVSSRASSSTTSTSSAGYHHEVQQHGFVPLNGNTTTLGYNLAVNTETKPYLSRSSPRTSTTTTLPPHIPPVQGNSQPGCPTRPMNEILPNYNHHYNLEGPPGELNKRTGPSPDSTTEYSSTTKSFLASRAGNASSEALSAPKEEESRNDETEDFTTSKLISIIQDIDNGNDIFQLSALASMFQSRH